MAPAWLSHKLGFLVELLAAIPSVVYGLWGVFVLGPWLRDHVDPILAKYLGFLPFFQGPRISVSMLTAAVVLAIMILPYISAVCTDVFRVVPQTQREAAFALGATKWEMVRMAVLPFGVSGVIGAVILGLGRALGETIAVAMVIGNRPEISASLFMPSSTLASVIANEFVEATSDLNLAALVELGLVLLVLGLILNIAARTLVYGATQRRFRQGQVMLDNPAQRRHDLYRNLKSKFMVGLTIVATVIALIPLFLVLGYLLSKGAASVNWDFFTKMPTPVGQNGGGMANAIMGTFELVGIATPDRRADRSRRGRLPGRESRQSVGPGNPLCRRRDDGHPVDRHRHLRVRDLRQAVLRLLDALGRDRARHHHDSAGHAHRRRDDPAGAARIARGGAGVGRAALAHNDLGGGAHRDQRYRDRRDPRGRARRRRDRAAACSPPSAIASGQLRCFSRSRR